MKRIEMSGITIDGNRHIPIHIVWQRTKGGGGRERERMNEIDPKLFIFLFCLRANWKDGFVNRKYHETIEATYRHR